MALGVLVGRIGDLIVGDHLGKATTFFLGYRCPGPGHVPASPCVPGTVIHQTALYDLIMVAVLLFALLRLRRTPRYDGYLITLFGAWYGVQRIIEDFLRDDLRRFGLTGSQITAIITVLLCLWHLTFVRRTPRWGQWDEGAETPPTMAGEAEPLEPQLEAPVEPDAVERDAAEREE
jgi:prolipoprotein diacylglyceryltransferase